MRGFFKTLITSGIADYVTEKEGFVLLAEENPELWLRIWERAWELSEKKLFVDNVCSWRWQFTYDNKRIDEDILTYCIHTGKGLYGSKGE
ncbi:MAG: hypothetical protein NC203_12190 [Firmicutes bacterium]|nr:hypothetical protein [[Eubacterium] siraeum]MCM1489113.1 hypothetical protein [Bacillota bacterium]